MISDPESTDTIGCCNNGYYDTCGRPVLSEFLGTVIYVFVAGMAAQTGDLTIIAVAQGLVIILLAITFTPVSGGHFNPALSIAVLISGQISMGRALYYILFQTAGSLVAGGFVKACSSAASYAAQSGGAPLISGGTSAIVAITLESLLTFTLILIYLICQVDEDRPMAPIAHGFVYLVGLLISIPITGGVINPCRSFGLSVVYSSISTDHWAEQWVYYVSAAIGALSAAVLYRTAVAPPDRRWDCTGTAKMD